MDFTADMNLACVRELEYWDLDYSLNQLNNIHLLENLEKIQFNLTPKFKLDQVNLAQFPLLREAIIETEDNITEFMQ